MMGRGIMRVFGETLLVTVCFLHLSDQGRLETCSKPAECYSYLNITQNSTNGDPRNCTIKDFNVTIINNTALPADEGSDVSVTCVHNLTNAFISWKMDNQLQEERSEKFEIQNILRETFLKCEVHSICGVINSNIIITVNGDPRNCTIKDVIIINNTALPADEGSDVSVTCVHNLTNASIRWKMDNQLQEERSETFKIQNILRETFLECEVHSICGLINSNITITVNVANNMVIILLCVGAAAALLMMFAIAMKISLRRGQAQSRARKRQRQQNMENIHSTTMNTVSSYD